MAHFLNDDLEYVVDDFYDVADFEEDPFGDYYDPPHKNNATDSLDSDFEDDFDLVRALASS